MPETSASHSIEKSSPCYLELQAPVPRSYRTVNCKLQSLLEMSWPFQSRGQLPGKLSKEMKEDTGSGSIIIIG